MSSAAARLKIGVLAAAAYSLIASSSKAASGPKIMSTWSRSISSWVLVLAPAGLPPVSPTTSSTLRPAIVLFRSLRNRSTPCSIWMPPAASGPVLTVRRPMRTGLLWARARVGRAAAPAASAVLPARKERRLSVSDIAASCGEEGLGLAGHPPADRDVTKLVPDAVDFGEDGLV